MAEETSKTEKLWAKPVSWIYAVSATEKRLIGCVYRWNNGVEETFINREMPLDAVLKMEHVKCSPE